MIKATTKHGTYYLIDEDNQLAMRVKAENRNPMHGDNQWFRFSSVFPFDRDTKQCVEGGIQVGKAIYFTVIGDRDYDWRISTNVVSIEDYNDFQFGAKIGEASK